MIQTKFPIGKVFLAPVLRFWNCALFPGHPLCFNLTEWLPIHCNPKVLYSWWFYFLFELPFDSSLAWPSCQATDSCSIIQDELISFMFEIFSMVIPNISWIMKLLVMSATMMLIFEWSWCSSPSLFCFSSSFGHILS
jgi:hypothetical protein